MEGNKETYQMLDLMIRPGFCVRDQKIEYANPAAQALFLIPGTDVLPLLATGREEYAAFAGGCLYLELQLGEKSCGASVSRFGGCDVFTLEPETADDALQALALAAMELRQPLLNAMLFADHLPAGPETQDSLARLNRGLYQLHRIINNMSDAGRLSSISRQQMQDVGKAFAEIFEKAQTLVAHTGITLTYRGLEEKVLALMDREQMERAVLNMLSNALKFTPKGGTLEAELSRRGTMVRLSILDSGCGISQNILPGIYSRYLRQPGLEDSRFGLGLGMKLIAATAAGHGGTVLIDQPGETGTRITLTMQLKQGGGSHVRTPIELPGGQDLGLIELSDCLPASVYEK